jgi:hypothetical protein
VALAILHGQIEVARAQEPPTTRELLLLINEHKNANTQRFEAQEKAVSAALAAAKEATAKAEGAAEKRFDSVNEFRATLKDQQAMLIPRAEVDAKLHSIEEKIAVNAVQVAQLNSKAEGVAQLWGFISVGAGIIIAGSALFLRRRA